MTAAAEHLRNRLVNELTGHGWLADAWRPAFTAVPRHLFLPRFFRQTPDRSRYEAVDGSDPGALELVYSNSVLPTQLDGDDARWDESRHHGPIDGVPTCSSTQPALMAVMLDALDVADGHRVLEVGTGTGYNATLLAHRLGSPLVTTVDIDAGLVRRARQSLAAVGYAPTVAATDGAAGYPGNAPYDRIIATCSVPRVPAVWLTQTRPGGVILTNLHREIGGGLLLRLTVDETGAASGHLLDDYGAFMPLRSCPTTRTSTLVRAASQASGDMHETHLPGPLADDGEAWTALVALLLPDVARLDIDRPDGPVQWLVHPDGSWAYHDISTHTVEQGGPRRLWTEVEDLYSRWTAHGKPTRPHIGVTIASTGQQVWLNDPGEIIG
ncbi:ATP-grasp peptide maturase system methyltransferase [Salinispora arenicola]|uniref:Protein-L-isoaspartate O-methyltransferase n=1 Tax=Salinispora arenicola TaxID=168697 RepID=A0A542XRU0_SALAC|nr:ATP-grasp peptide maturase system methyltransferase [Salinispora arenicola]TQL38567.1 protein-L-isoaspartate(D-aspartate) O-methyltransferase [Salinispora arenicola]GIM84369.1 protein-L-isoaspartate O-methyltransferase [Salinispora arenicola]